MASGYEGKERGGASPEFPSGEVFKPMLQDLLPVYGSECLTIACSRRLTASAPTSLRLPGAADAWR